MPPGAAVQSLFFWQGEDTHITWQTGRSARKAGAMPSSRVGMSSFITCFMMNLLELCVGLDSANAPLRARPEPKGEAGGAPSCFT